MENFNICAVSVAACLSMFYKLINNTFIGILFTQMVRTRQILACNDTATNSWKIIKRSQNLNRTSDSFCEIYLIGFQPGLRHILLHHICCVF